VTLFEGAGEIGGQFNVAKRIPGKEEFHATLRYFRRQLELTGVEVHLKRRVTAPELANGGFDDVVLATGVTPRRPDIPGSDHRKVVSYLDVLLGDCQVGRSVAIVGAGGIGFDVAEFLSHEGDGANASLDVETFMREWGVDMSLSSRGGLLPQPGAMSSARRQIWLLQRKAGMPGQTLGKTTGWIHRTTLRRRGVQMLGGVTYERIDDAGLHIVTESGPRTLGVDHVVICAGQLPLRDLQGPLEQAGHKVHLIGGSKVAAELDAKRAIDEGARLAAAL
jgi:2,4-dienoyl-CoA reductase (NADPH2)